MNVSMKLAAAIALGVSVIQAQNLPDTPAGGGAAVLAGPELEAANKALGEVETAADVIYRRAEKLGAKRTEVNRMVGNALVKGSAVQFESEYVFKELTPELIAELRELVGQYDVAAAKVNENTRAPAGPGVQEFFARFSALNNILDEANKKQTLGLTVKPLPEKPIDAVAVYQAKAALVGGKTQALNPAFLAAVKVHIEAVDMILVSLHFALKDADAKSVEAWVGSKREPVAVAASAADPNAANNSGIAKGWGNFLGVGVNGVNFNQAADGSKPGSGGVTAVPPSCPGPGCGGEQPPASAPPAGDSGQSRGGQGQGMPGTPEPGAPQTPQREEVIRAIADDLTAERYDAAQLKLDSLKAAPAQVQAEDVTQIAKAEHATGNVAQMATAPFAKDDDYEKTMANISEEDGEDVASRKGAEDKSLERIRKAKETYAKEAEAANQIKDPNVRKLALEEAKKKRDDEIRAANDERLETVRGLGSRKAKEQSIAEQRVDAFTHAKRTYKGDFKDQWDNARRAAVEREQGLIPETTNAASLKKIVGEGVVKKFKELRDKDEEYAESYWKQVVAANDKGVNPPDPQQFWIDIYDGEVGKGDKIVALEPTPDDEGEKFDPEAIVLAEEQSAAAAKAKAKTAGETSDGNF